MAESSFISYSPHEIIDEFVDIFIWNTTAVARGMKRVVPMLWGPTATGKSEIIQQALAQAGIPVDKQFQFRTATKEPIDLNGNPYIDRSTEIAGSATAPPITLPIDPQRWNGNCAMIWDEINQGDAAMQAACYQPILEYKIGNLPFIDTVQFVAMGNRIEDRGNATDMPQPLKTRLRHYMIEPNMGDWIKWAFQQDINPMIIAFLRTFPQYFYNMDYDGYASPSPRTWEMLSNALQMGNNDKRVFMTSQSCVGPAAASAFEGFVKDYDSIPDIDNEILANPGSAKIPTGSVLYALCVALARRADKTNFGTILRYASRLDSEYQILLVRDVAAAHPQLQNTPEFQDWAIKNAEVIL